MIELSECEYVNIAAQTSDAASPAGIMILGFPADKSWSRRERSVD